MRRLTAQQKLGKKVKLFRKKLGYSQEYLGELAGLDRTYISGIERGVRNPSIANIDKIARALGLNISDLID